MLPLFRRVFGYNQRSFSSSSLRRVRFLLLKAVLRMNCMKGADMCGSSYRQAIIKVKLMVQVWMALFGFISVLLIISLPARASTNIPTAATFVYVTDFLSGRVLMEKQKDAPMKPASMAKIMTAYIVFDRIAEGTLALTDQFIVSEKAWKMGGSRSFLQAGRSYSLDELLHGVIVLADSALGAGQIVHIEFAHGKVKCRAQKPHGSRS